MRVPKEVYRVHPIFTQYQTRLQNAERSPLTLKNFRLASQAYERTLTEKGLDPLTAEPWQVEEAFSEMEYAPSTKGIYLTYVSAAYRYAMRRGMVERDPTVDVLLPKPQLSTPRIISNAELREMRDERALTERLYFLWHLLVYTGMRRAELEGLRWEHINLREGTLRVVHGKGGKERLLPIHPVLGEALADRQLPEGRVTTAMNYDAVYKLTGKRYAFHDFRRTFGTSLDRNGAKEAVVRVLMGHAPSNIFQRHYRHVAPEEMQEAILKLYADDPL